MRAVTFYSYKGGVGRTLTLVETAKRLAKEGMRVVVLDLDLEAPGLHFKLLNETQRKTIVGGFVDIASAFVRSGLLPSLRELSVSATPTELPGEVIVLPAGKAEANQYWTALARLDWQKLFAGDSGVGVHLFLALREAIQEQFQPDVLLADSRTGITEIGSAALSLLADDVVCMFSNNDESIWGTAAVMKAIRHVPRPPSRSDLRIVPVLSRFPAGESSEPDVLDSLRQRFDLAGASVEQVFVIHSCRHLEVNERAAEASVGTQEPILADYKELLRSGLRFDPAQTGELSLDAIEQQARGADGEEAVDCWRRLVEALDRMPIERVAERLCAALLNLADAKVRANHGDAFAFYERVARQERFPQTARLRAMAECTILAAKTGDATGFERWWPQVLDGYTTVNSDDKGRTKLTLCSEFSDQMSNVDANHLHILLEWEHTLPKAEATRDEEETLMAALRRTVERLEDDDLAESLPNELVVNVRRVYAQRLSAIVGTGAVTIDVSVSGTAITERRSPQPPKHEALPRKRDTLPPKRAVARRGGPPTTVFDVRLQVVTPILGGAAVPRTIDEVDVIRVPTVRGHLRSWWRAVFGGGLTPKELSERECRIWGGAASDAEGSRSGVEVSVTVHRETVGEIDRSDVKPYGRDATTGAYALWPARATAGGDECAPRRGPGTQFTVHIKCEQSLELEVRTALKAWVLFGGYGGRTRRGLGSLTVVQGQEATKQWLPSAATREELTRVFGRDLFAFQAADKRSDLPVLAGAGLRASRARPDAVRAWEEALRWLSDFRQGGPSSGSLHSHDPKFARARGDDRRPGRSNWPEPDKIRMLSTGKHWAHEPLHNKRPVWPRAGFGLPIIGRFQGRDRNNERYAHPEPGPFKIVWKSRESSDGESHERLASPLIVKALPLADGTFAPCALWLSRAYPNGVVVLEAEGGSVSKSAAEFDELVAPGDNARFAPLARAQSAPTGSRLRDAFLNWLADTGRAPQEVAK